MSTNNTEIRLLLNLWDLGEGQGVVNKGKLLRSASKEKTKADAYKNTLLSLIDSGAIAVSKEKRTEKYALSDAGLQKLVGGLRSPDFGFEGAAVGSRLANAALRLVLQNQGQFVESAPKISSYDEFKAVALETYKRLSYESNVSKLVPIYQIRRDIGDRVTRTQFNDWMLEMHRTDVLHLHDGGSLQATDDQNRDSIYSELLKTYYFNAELFN
jgi:hypothetical protein